MLPDPDRWARTVDNHCWGDTDWTVMVDGEAERFRLPDWLATLDRGPVAERMVIGEVSGGGVSMTTGEIGSTVWVDEHGDAWASRWGYDTKYLGAHSTDFEPVDELIDVCFPDGYSTFTRITSDTGPGADERERPPVPAAHNVEPRHHRLVRRTDQPAPTHRPDVERHRLRERAPTAHVGTQPRRLRMRERTDDEKDEG